jgi:uncharacterized membrane protein
MKTLLSLFLVILTIFGVLDASYISYEKITGVIPPCTVQFKCGQVLSSPWANIGPIPLAVIGLLFYSLFFILSVSFYLGRKEIMISNFRIKIEKALALQGTFGAVFSLYLLFVMGVILKAWCVYCLLSAVTCIMLFLVSSTLYFISSKENKI